MGSEPLLFLCLPSVHVSASSSRRPDVDADQWINQYPPSHSSEVWTKDQRNLLFPPVFTAKKQQRFIPFICWKLQNKSVWDWTKHPVCAWTSQIPTFSVPASYFLSLEPSGYETRLNEGKQKRLRLLLCWAKTELHESKMVQTCTNREFKYETLSVRERSLFNPSREVIIFSTDKGGASVLHVRVKTSSSFWRISSLTVQRGDGGGWDSNPGRCF